jgi:ferritin-like metal-binding protein YciE
MPMVTLRDLYIVELQDLFDAEQQILQVLPAMTAAATSSVLREAFEEHLEQTRIHAERLELLLRKLDAAGNGSPCEAIRGLIAESRHRMADGNRGDVLDAALIGAAQRIEHYEIAAYGCARTYAQTLKDDEAAMLLQQTLDEEGAADERLTRIAERGVNKGAGEGIPADTERQRERLRYIPASRIREFKYREFRVINVAGEDLGSLDGLVVDARTQRPDYFVIDSGGWFVGQRYLVPIAALRPDDATQTLRTDLERKAIEAYPAFNPDSFEPIDDSARAAMEEYQPPTWLMTGVWMTEASGFATVPPRAQADLGAEPQRATPVDERYPQNERMVARGEPEDRSDAAQKKNSEPRIERYPER